MVTMDSEPRERSARDAREHFADVVNDAVQGRITYITSHGRRLAAVVPLTSIHWAAGSSDVAGPAVTP